MIRLLIVDDSVTYQRLLAKALEGESDFEIVGSAATGVEAVRMAEALRPTLITMDIQMPDMDGLAATEQIMTQCPTRIVIVSSEVGSPDQKVTFDALQAGALEVLPKPKVTDAAGFARYRSELVSTLRAMASVQVLRRRRGGSGIYLRPSPPPDLPPVETLPRHSPTSLVPGVGTGVNVVQLGRRYRFVAIGASTGGPQVIAQLLAGLPADLAFPLALVQHMSPGFTVGFTRWLQGETKLKVKLAEEGESPAPGTVYVGPDRQHLRLGRDWKLHLSTDHEGYPFHPSVDVLFQSVAVAAGRGGIGLLLTGMGTDGAKGLAEMHRAGAWTLAQDGDSCVVNGMPSAAAKLGAVTDFVSPSMIPGLLKEASALH